MKTIRPKQFKRSATVVTFSALCLVLGTATISLAASPPGRAHQARASSPPDGMSWHTYHLMMAQAPLDAAATKIQALTFKPGPAHRGFFETAVNDTKHLLTVYWHGQLPANVRRLITRLRATVNIRVIQTRYSLAALNKDVLAAIHSGRDVTGGAPLGDGSGLQLTVRSANPRSVASAMRSRLGVPVVASQGGVDQPLYCSYNDYLQPPLGDNLGPGSRCDDLGSGPGEAFWGGDLIQQRAIPGYVTYCSGGFGLHNSAGVQYLITAEHCANNGSGYANNIQFYNGQDPSSWQNIGPIAEVTSGSGYDSAIIRASTGNQYYDGPGIPDYDTYHTKTVAGQQAVSVGDSMCESGAIGGVECGFTVKVVNYSIADLNYRKNYTWVGLALTTTSGGTPQEGDSGGPWFSLDGCCTHVWAKGITQGAFTFNGITYYDFTPLVNADTAMGLTVNTG